MVRRVTLVTIDVSGELSASFIRVTRIGNLGTISSHDRSRKKRNETEEI
jgi:hypothetical protein